MVTSANTISKKQSRLFGFLIFAGVFLIIIALMAVIKVTPYTSYKDPAMGFSIKYPSYWKLIEHPDGAAVVAFATPQQTAMDTYADSVNITFQNLTPKTMSLSQFSQLAMNQLTGTFKGEVEVVESEPTSMAGRPAYRFIYVFTPKEAPLKFMHIFVVTNTRGYIFTYSSTQKDFDVFLGEVNAMVKSFAIL